MQQIPNAMANLYQTQLQASRRVADAFFSGTEQLDRLVLEATHRAVNDQLSIATAMANGGQDPTTGANLANTLVQRNSEGAVNYQAEIVRVVAEMQTEIGKSVQDYIEQFSSQATNLPARAAESAQTAMPGATDMANPMTGMLSMWENAFRQATEMATRNMSAARSNMDQAAESAETYTRGASRAAGRMAEGAAESTRKASDASEAGGSRKK